MSNQIESDEDKRLDNFYHKSRIEIRSNFLIILLRYEGFSHREEIRRVI